MFSGIGIIAIILITMTIVICVMKYRKDTKMRDSAATEHYRDSSRGTEQMLSPNNNAESRYSTYEALTSSGRMKK